MTGLTIHLGPLDISLSPHDGINVWRSSWVWRIGVYLDI